MEGKRDAKKTLDKNRVKNEKTVQGANPVTKIVADSYRKVDNRTMTNDEPRSVRKRVRPRKRAQQNGEVIYRTHLHNYNELITIRTEDECVLQLSFYQFHGFYRLKGMTECRICGIHVGNLTHKHILNENHVAYTSKKFEDMHCIRMIDSKFNFCVLCNIAVSHPDIHKKLKRHVTKLLRAIKPPYANASTKGALAALIIQHFLPAKYAQAANEPMKKYNETKYAHQGVFNRNLIFNTFLSDSKKNNVHPPKEVTFQPKVKQENVINNKFPMKTTADDFQFIHLKIKENFPHEPFITTFPKTRFELSKITNYEKIDYVHHFNYKEELDEILKYTPVLHSYCENCYLRIDTRFLSRHLSSDQHMANVNVMGMPHFMNGFNTNGKSNLDFYLKSAETSLLAAEIWAGETGWCNRDLENNVMTMERISSLLERIKARMYDSAYYVD